MFPLDELFARLDALVGAMDVEAVEHVALAALKRHGGDRDLWRYVSWAQFEQGRLRDALAAAERADDPLYRAKAQFHLWTMEDAGRTLASYEPDDPEAGDLVGRFVGVSLEVPDIQATYETLVERGVDFVAPPQKQEWGGVLAHLRDPDGNVVTLLG